MLIDIYTPFCLQVHCQRTFTVYNTHVKPMNKPNIQ